MDIQGCATQKSVMPDSAGTSIVRPECQAENTGVSKQMGRRWNKFVKIESPSPLSPHPSALLPKLGSTGKEENFELDTRANFYLY